MLVLLHSSSFFLYIHFIISLQKAPSQQPSVSLSLLLFSLRLKSTQYPEKLLPLWKNEKKSGKVVEDNEPMKKQKEKSNGAKRKAERKKNQSINVFSFFHQSWAPLLLDPLPFSPHVFTNPPPLLRLLLLIWIQNSLPTLLQPKPCPPILKTLSILYPLVTNTLTEWENSPHLVFVTCTTCGPLLTNPNLSSSLILQMKPHYQTS